MYYFFRKLVEVYIKTKYRVTIHNPQNIMFLPKKGGYIIACNHQTYTDPPAVAALIRGKFSFMAKSELFKNPFFAWLIRRCGAFPVVRGAGDNSAIERAISDIRKGRILLIFPEGTRSKDGTISRARSGIAVIAAAAGAPVLPVCIMYGLNNDKKRLDFAVGELIDKSELSLTDSAQEESGSKSTADDANLENSVKNSITSVSGQQSARIRQISQRIIGEVKALQQVIFDNVDNLRK